MPNKQYESFSGDWNDKYVQRLKSNKKEIIGTNIISH
jgi:hypothetical protein